MESEGAKRVFDRSIPKHNLRCMELLCGGDSKSFINVKDTYPDPEIKKCGCVGHYQKRVGTELRNLKKKEKGLGGHGRQMLLLIGCKIILEWLYDKILESRFTCNVIPCRIFKR